MKHADSPAKAVELLLRAASDYQFDAAVDAVLRTRQFHALPDVWDAFLRLRKAAGDEWPRVRDRVDHLRTVEATAFAVRCGLTRKASPGEINPPIRPEVEGLNGERLMEQVEVVADGPDFLIQVRVRPRG